MNYRELIGEYKLASDSGDAWGSAMGAFFDVAAELHMRELSGAVPAEWKYRPGAVSDPRDRESYFFDLCLGAGLDDLTRFGWLLHRYTNLLRAAGRSY